MREAVIHLEDGLFDELAREATVRKIGLPELIEELLSAWSTERKNKGEKREDQDQRRYVKMRMKGLTSKQIAEKLERTEEDFNRWDEEIRSNPTAWKNAFFSVRKASDPLMWEMKLMDRFYGLWGKQPKDS